MSTDANKSESQKPWTKILSSIWMRPTTSTYCTGILHNTDELLH